MEDQIIIEDGVPAIVSKELWEKAQVARKYMARASSNAKHQYLLSGLLWCVSCGSKMHGTYRTNNNRSYTTYRCNNQATRLDCDLHEMNAPALENFVIDSLCRHFFDPENIDVITEEINRKLREDINAGREEIKAVKYSIAGLRTARNNLVDAIAEHGYSKTLSDRLKDLEEQIEKYEKMIADDESKTLDVRVTRDEVVQRIEKMRECLKNPDNFEQTKILLRKYVDRIEISNTRIKVVFRTTFSCYIDDEEYTASYGFEVENTWREVMANYRQKAHKNLNT